MLESPLDLNKPARYINVRHCGGEGNLKTIRIKREAEFSPVSRFHLVAI